MKAVINSIKKRAAIAVSVFANLILVLLVFGLGALLIPLIAWFTTMNFENFMFFVGNPLGLGFCGAFGAVTTLLYILLVREYIQTKKTEKQVHNWMTAIGKKTYDKI